MSIASWKVRAGLPVAILLAGACAPAYGQSVGTTIGTNPKPVITSISAVQVPGQKFRIFGTVSDDTPGSCTVTLIGSANGSVACDASGQFSAVFDVPLLGPSTATASDGVQNSDAATVTATNAAPSTSCVCTVGAGNTLTISGRVTDEAPGGLTVILSGSRAVGGLSAIVLANGTWSVSTSIPAGSHGNVTATVTDWYGLSGAGYGSY
jgi:hypothetical protein